MSKQETEDVLQFLDELESEESKVKNNRTSKGDKLKNNEKNTEKKDEDILGFLDSLATDPTVQKLSSRSGTPVTDKDKDKDKTERKSAAQPTSSVDQKVENQHGGHGSSTDTSKEKDAADKGRSSSDENRAEQEGGRTIPVPDVGATISSLSGWWSKNREGLWGQASAAVKNAESKLHELQEKNLKPLDDTLKNSEKIAASSLGIFKNTLSNLVVNIVPPISSTEKLRIHVFYDLIGFKSIDDMVFDVFYSVMQQVEGGGELILVTSKNTDSDKSVESQFDAFNLSDFTGSKPIRRVLPLFRGTVENGEKLAKANIEEGVKRFKELQASKAGNAGKAENAENAENTEKFEKIDEETSMGPRFSDVYICIQPTTLAAEEPQQSEDSEGTGEFSRTITSQAEDTFFFIVQLMDPDHDISISTHSQSFPLEWASWLDEDARQASKEFQKIYNEYEVDPGKWVADWVENSIGSAIGVVAQSYVLRRMGF